MNARRLAQLATLSRSFRLSTHGGISVIAGITSVAFVAGMGMAVDGARLSTASVALQGLLDAASLAAAAPINMNDPDRIALAKLFVSSGAYHYGLTNVVTSVSVGNNRVYV